MPHAVAASGFRGDRGRLCDHRGESEEHALEIAREFMEIHRVHWPEFEGESEIRPLESEAGGPPEA